MNFRTSRFWFLLATPALSSYDRSSVRKASVYRSRRDPLTARRPLFLSGFALLSHIAVQSFPRFEYALSNKSIVTKWTQ